MLYPAELRAQHAAGNISLLNFQKSSGNANWGDSRE
jgi:hypothetical protein